MVRVIIQGKDLDEEALEAKCISFENNVISAVRGMEHYGCDASEDFDVAYAILPGMRNDALNWAEETNTKIVIIDPDEDN